LNKSKDLTPIKCPRRDSVGGHKPDHGGDKSVVEMAKKYLKDLDTKVEKDTLDLLCENTNKKQIERSLIP